MMNKKLYTQPIKTFKIKRMKGFHIYLSIYLYIPTYIKESI